MKNIKIAVTAHLVLLCLLLGWYIVYCLCPGQEKPGYIGVLVLESESENLYKLPPEYGSLEGGGLKKHERVSTETADYTLSGAADYNAGPLPLVFSVKAKKGSSNEKVVFLTIDDGPSSITSGFLDVLKAEKVPATFCLIGNKVKAYESIIKRMHEEGHAVINHTYNHEYSEIYRSPQALISSLKKSDEILDSVIERTESEKSFMRFPGGAGMIKSNRAAFADALIANGYNTIEWSIDTRDSSVGIVTREFVLSNGINERGSSMVVVLMHDFKHRKVTLDALPDIIKYYRDKGYAFRSVRDISVMDIERLKKIRVVNVLY